MSSASRHYDNAHELLREFSGCEPAAYHIGPMARALRIHDERLLAPIIAECRKELETGSAISGGTSLARKILTLLGEP